MSSRTEFSGGTSPSRRRNGYTAPRYSPGFSARPGGDLPPVEVERFVHAGEALRRTYADSLIRGAIATASSSAAGHGAEQAVDGERTTWWGASDGGATAWLEIDLRRQAEFDRLLLREAITQGQAIAAYRLLAGDGGPWREVCAGGTVGRQRIAVFPPVLASRLRIELTTTGAPATLREVGLTMGPRPTGHPNSPLKCGPSGDGQ